MKIYEASVQKRIASAFLWSIAIMALVFGRRLLHAQADPNYEVQWFVYVLGFLLPVVLLFIPRLLTAISVRFEADTITLGYLFGSPRIYDRPSMAIKTQNKSVIVLSGNLRSGQAKASYLLSAGFDKKSWHDLATELKNQPQNKPCVATGDNVSS